MLNEASEPHDTSERELARPTEGAFPVLCSRRSSTLISVTAMKQIWGISSQYSTGQRLEESPRAMYEYEWGFDTIDL